MQWDSVCNLLDFSRDIYSVSRLNREACAVLEGGFPLLWVEGELSNLAQPASGHIYFSLKDPAAQVRCAMFRSKRLLLGFKPANHQQVLVRARVGLYEGRGEFQLIVEHMEPAGEGALRLQFERLKQRLAVEGLFDESHKRPLPSIPRQVGLITSPTGAAVRDLLTVLGRRFPALPVLIYPAQVQGESAARELVAALDLANGRAECDVLILARGGGSLEDLQAFNDEALARAICRSAIPVVTGIGHEIDLSIADLAADRRGATPSAAAELVSPSAQHMAQRVGACGQRLEAALTRELAARRQGFAAAERHLRLLHPRDRLRRRQRDVEALQRRLATAVERRLAEARRRLDPLTLRVRGASPQGELARRHLIVGALGRRLDEAVDRILDARGERLARAVQGLEARSPLATLTRGFAILRRVPTGRVITDAGRLVPGDRVDARLARGRLILEVVEVVGED
ncbi:exodeoxyribonuclease VII large subunit [Candidatus Thiosymbion oneisti]|uniref:exodeoxyribonuclease VII large subunit n=1 Tax=Candidatus Thiosymbion oneisti TaxID=589554 RepID=UPI000A8B624C|nr:exodeoxyribonuclease VII large subunit [Candidatus Thiosymbion oneisti]